MVAEVIRLEYEHVCDCANCCETWVPTILNDNVSPLFAFAIFCSSVVKLVTVDFVLANGTGSVNVQPRVGAKVDGRPPLLPSTDVICPTVLTLEKFAIVMPDPCSAASTSSRPVFKPDVTVMENNT